MQRKIEQRDAQVCDWIDEVLSLSGPMRLDKTALASNDGLTSPLWKAITDSSRSSEQI